MQASGLRELRLTLDGWMVTSALLVIAIICPLLVIVVGLFQPTGEVWEHIRETVLLRYFGNTLLLIIAAASLTLTLGGSTAWLIALYDFPGKRLLEWALVLPLAIPTYIAAFAYAGLLDYTGPVQTCLRWMTSGPVRFPFEIMSMGGVIFVISFVLYPYVYLLARNAFRSQSASMLEAARMMGKSPFRVFTRVGLPASRTALAAGVGLVIMESLNDYGAVKYYGVDTLTTGIFRAWFAMDDFDSAVRLSACLMLLTFIVLTLERWHRGRARYHGQRSDRALTATQLTGGQAVAAMVVCSIPFLFGFLVPFFQISYWSFIAIDQGASSQMIGWIWNSFRLGAFSALLTLVVAIIIAYTVRLHRHLAIDLISRFALVGYSIPGAVIAVGVLVILLSSDRLLDGWISTGLLLTGSLVGLVFAYLVRFLAVGYGAVESGFDRLSGRYHEAARSLGRSPLRTLLEINFPLAGRALLGGGLLVFIEIVKELPLTLILRPFNFDTLATKVFELAGDERLPESGLGAIAIVATSLIPILLLERFIARRHQ